MNNESRRICILTNKGIDKAPEKLKPIIHLLSGKKEEMDDAFYRKIQAAVNEIKTDPEVRRGTMNQLERDDAIRREGIEEERINSIRNFCRTFRKLNLPEKEIFEQLADAYPGFEETIRKIMNEQ